MYSKTLTLVVIAILIPDLNSEYIPPGPRYPCPKEKDRHLMFPCICEKGTDAGLYISCDNTGLSVLSIGLGNIASFGFPIERLIIKEAKISHLFGSLLHRSSVRVLKFIDTPIKTIDQYAFAGVNKTLQELYMVNTKIQEFPKDAFKILSNLSILSIDGHEMQTLNKDIFGGSLAAGKLERLHLVNGLINDLHPDALQFLKKLKTLDLHGNKFVTLKRSQFKGLRDTEVLDISHNNITKLDGSHIGDLSKLGWCNVSHNQISEMPRGMFARNTVLKVLHLDNNKIKKLDTNSFRGMRFLRRLYLQDNQINDVGRGTFSAVTRIGTIDLARNQITKVDYQMFQQVKYAELVNLAENKITIIETQAFTDLYLAVVNISYNQLTTVEGGSFQNCNNLTVLDFSHNNLTGFEKAAFDENSYASLLDVSYNAFTDFGQLPIQNMSGIKVINASFNQIALIPRMAFPKLYELHTVDVSHNNLSEIFNSVFQNLFSLRFLYLGHNSMKKIKPSTFGTLPTVLELDLSHNQLEDVSKGSLAQLASCRLLDISHNMLEKIFQIPISLGELKIDNNKLTEIPSHTFPSMNALLRLNLSNNQLADNLQSDSFQGLLTLQKLDLSGNGLTKPPWEALNSMSSLQYLYLQNNNLTSLTRAAFGNLPTLFELELSSNQIATVERKSFAGMQQLLRLSLSGNMLRTMPNEAFKGLVALRKLDLSHNYLEKIDNKTNGLLDDCLSLEMVDLSHNKIGFLTKKMFPSNPWIPYRIFEADLSHNAIPVLTMDITHGTGKLKKLNLSGNSINDIRNYVIGNFTSLEVLDLSNNQLKDLASRTSESNLTLPQNLTHLHLQNNSLQALPTKAIQESQLRVLDVRFNNLDSLKPEILKRIVDRKMDVYFEGNYLTCNCLIRPLKHYINHFSSSQLTADDKYKNIVCAEPSYVQNETLLSVDEDRLLCSGVVGNSSQDGDEDRNFDYVPEPDVVFRDIQYAQSSIYANWFVLSNQDVADFFIYIRDGRNNLLYSNKVAYNLRSLTITIDKEFETSLRQNSKRDSSIDVCIQAKSSDDSARKWYESQCRQLESNFESWPKKLSVDKRRLTKKKGYKSYRSSVLGLVGDSILLTLCIFLGVCFRKLYDVDL